MSIVQWLLGKPPFKWLLSKLLGRLFKGTEDM